MLDLTEAERDHAVALLRQVATWRLSPRRWQAIRAQMTALEAAVAAGDREATFGALTNLATLGPRRVSRPSPSPNSTLPPADILVIPNQIVRTLQTALDRPPAAADADRDAGQGGSGPGGGRG
jgi:hypothetical protein